MPSVSQAQNRFMHAAAEGSIKGVSPQVGKDFVNADAGRKIGTLPEHKEKTRLRVAMAMMKKPDADKDRM